MAPRRPTGARATEPSIQEALSRYIRDAALPFAITRGHEHAIGYANSAFRRLGAIAIGQPIDASIADKFDASELSRLKLILDEAWHAGVDLCDQRLDVAGTRGSGWQVNVWPVIGRDGKAEALGIEIREPPSEGSVELQRQIAEQMLLGALRERGLADDAEAARRRAAFLAEAGRLLAESVDQASTLLALTKLVLPTLGAWCIVDILEPSGAIHRLGIYHADPDKQTLARTLETKWIPAPDDAFGASAMLRDPRTFTISEDVEATLAGSAHNPQDLETLRRLGIGPLLTVPLLARNKLLGAITFVSAQRGVAYTAEDVQLAEDLASRGALALDNAQVYDLAITLKRSAELANRAKTAFLGAMSHELRTPLNAIGGYIELLDMGLRGPVTEQQHADFARVKASQKHLTLLITEILNFARAESGRISYDIKNVNACDAMRHAIDLIEPLFAQKGLVFDGVSGNADVVGRGDPDRITQILVNLLSNAIKFTPPGGHISADCAVRDANITIRVSDTGIGIEPQMLESIFEPFVQLRESLTDREGGVGLGLAISRDLAQAMNGSLTVESNAGRGAHFTLSLPRAAELSEG
ncbi:MAG: HAMP domain-containing sensor histidine kinase [Gemmatimonadaceae bacterium]